MNSAALFKAYDSKLTNAAGETYAVRVVDSRDAIAFKDGTNGPALRVQEICYRAPRSPYAERSDRVYGNLMWVKAERVA